MIANPKGQKVGRIKPKWRPTPNAKEKLFHSWLRALGCLVCNREPSIHHVTSDDSGRIPRDHYHCTPLCPDHHQGQYGIHMLGHKKFCEMYGIDLDNEGKELLTTYKEQL